MTETATTHATFSGPVVVPAFTALEDTAARMRQASDIFREATSPYLLAGQRASRDAYALATASERVAKSLSASVRTLRAMRRAGHPATAGLYGRPEDLTRLDREARSVAHGNALLGVRIARFIGGQLMSNRTYTAHLAALAFRGVTDAREQWEALAESGDTEALEVLALLADLDALIAAADTLAGKVAHLAASATLTDLPETAEPIPPPRLTLAGSIDLCAPPVASQSAPAGNVRPAERSPMR